MRKQELQTQLEGAATLLSDVQDTPRLPKALKGADRRLPFGSRSQRGIRVGSRSGHVEAGSRWPNSKWAWRTASPPLVGLPLELV